MTPKKYQQGGANVPIFYATIVTRLGHTLIGATDKGICFLQFGANESATLELLKSEFPHATIAAMPASGQTQLSEWARYLDAFLAARKEQTALPLDIRGTAFQVLVWRYLQTIPMGEIRTYAEVAAAIGKPKAVRAPWLRHVPVIKSPC